LGYDSIVCVSLSFLGAGVGFAGAFLNPFTLQIAQGIAGLKPISGWEYRLVVWLISTALVITWVMIYAARVKKDPKRSPMYELDAKRRGQIEEQLAAQAGFTVRHGLCLAVLAATVTMMVVGVVAMDWYITELGGLFFAMGILAGIAGGMGPNTLAKAFIAGVKDMAGAALVVGFAGGILVILEDGNIMDTILYGMSSLTSKLPPLLAADAMYVVQMVLNFFIPSGSTKAALTMPLMAPLADLSGITRQTAVLAYQFGDGFTNMIIPTSGVTIGTLAMAKIPFGKWARWNLPLQAVFFVLALALLVWPVLSGWE
ncbi:MAG: YfcC family protein, partial [Deltaproteobacteria bacterium]|nr:YfcC family protein [Deltaproteobacteria bacterium]